MRKEENASGHELSHNWITLKVNLSHNTGVFSLSWICSSLGLASLTPTPCYFAIPFKVNSVLDYKEEITSVLGYEEEITKHESLVIESWLSTGHSKQFHN